MKEFCHQLLGLAADSDTITTGQMCARAVIVFLVALLLLRLSGKCTFASSSAFNMVLKIILGAVLSRAIVAASPFVGTLLASAVLVALHRLLAFAAYRSEFISHLIKGKPILLAENGRCCPENLRKVSMTEHDLLEGLRHSGHRATLEGIESVHLERNGHISVVKQRPGKKKQQSGASQEEGQDQ